MTRVPSVAFDKQVLKRGQHDRLVLDIDRYAVRAGIDPLYIWTAASSMLSAQAIEYLKRCLKLAKGDTPGAYYLTSADTSKQMAMMAGALIRAFVDARVMTVAQVLDELDGGGPEATVLLIPNFYEKAAYGAYEARRIAGLGDVLTYRTVNALPTIVHIDDFAAASSKLGSRIAGILSSMTELEV